MPYVFKNSKDEIEKFKRSENFKKYRYPENFLRDAFPNEREEFYKKNCSCLLNMILFNNDMFKNGYKIYLRYHNMFDFGCIPYAGLYFIKTSNNTMQLKLDYYKILSLKEYELENITVDMSIDIILTEIKKIASMCKNTLYYNDIEILDAIAEYRKEYHNKCVKYNNDKQDISKLNFRKYISLPFIKFTKYSKDEKLKIIIETVRNTLHDDYHVGNNNHQYIMSQLDIDDVKLLMDAKIENEKIKDQLFEKLGDLYIDSSNLILTDYMKSIWNKMFDNAPIKLKDALEFDSTWIKKFKFVGDVKSEKIISAIRDYACSLVEANLKKE